LIRGSDADSDAMGALDLLMTRRQSYISVGLPNYAGLQNYGGGPGGRAVVRVVITADMILLSLQAP
jgi:hypothetical protein